MSLHPPMPRFRIYTRASDYWQMARDLLTGRLAAGDDVSRLEHALATRLGVPHALCVAQGRVGIYLAVKALVKPGQTVVCSPYTIADVISMIICAGAVPVFADIDRATTNVRADTIEALVDERTGAVLVTHLHGMACDIETIATLCRARGIALIEDAAQAFGARVGGRDVGTFGDAGVYSFGMYKNLTAFYGGAVVTPREDVALTMRQTLADAPAFPASLLLSKVAKAWLTDVSTAPAIFKPLVYWIFRFAYLHGIRAINKFVTVELDTSRKTALPSTYLRRFLPVQARIVRRKLGDVDQHAEVRRRYARTYHEGLRDLPGLIVPPFRDDGSHVYNYYPVQYADRDALVRWAMQHGRDLAVQHLKNCAALDSFAPEARACPNAASTAAQTILLPNYPAYGATEVQRTIGVIRAFFDTGPGGHATR